MRSSSKGCRLAQPTTHDSQRLLRREHIGACCKDFEKKCTVSSSYCLNQTSALPNHLLVSSLLILLRMLPLLPTNPSLEDAHHQATESKQYGDDDSRKSRHHHISRTALPLKPLLEIPSRGWILELVVQVEKPRTPVLVFHRLFTVREMVR